MSSLPSKLISTLAAEAFASATLTIVETEQSRASSSLDAHKVIAYYRDSSGRARVHVRVRLEVATDDGNIGIESLIQCGCIFPSPIEKLSNDAMCQDYSEAAERETSENNDEQEDEVCRQELSTIGEEVGGNSSSIHMHSSFTFECTVERNANTMWSVERVAILRSYIERRSKAKKKSISAITFDVEIAVRGNGIIEKDGHQSLEEGELKLWALLKQWNECSDKDLYGVTSNNSRNKNGTSFSFIAENGTVRTPAGLLALRMSGGEHIEQSASFHQRNSIFTAISENSGEIATKSKNDTEVHYGTKITRTTPPLRILVTIIPPLQLTVREVCGARAASGSTLVEVTVEHSSQWHSENVTVTGIAFHPGQSRLWDVHQSKDKIDAVRISSGKSIQGGELSVIDMSRRVRWGFAPATALDLPLLLGPYDAFATVIQIDAGEDVKSRAFLSPITVNATVGFNPLSEEGERIMISTDARWTTSRVAVENSDAFKVDMSLCGGLHTICRVGTPLIVSLRVFNLSMEPRDLMLLMAKDDEGRNNGLQLEKPVDGWRAATRRHKSSEALINATPQFHSKSQASPSKDKHIFNTAVVSEVNGYTFGVWGLSGDDDGTTRHHRDHELLAVDAALLLGEVKGQHSVEAELRFVPLREGTLDVPNLKLYDKRGGRWYDCVHTLKIVASAKA